MKKIILVLCALTLLSGCSVRVLDLTVASTKNMNLNSDGFVNGGRVAGRDMIPVVFIPWGQATLKDAVDNTIENNKCAVGLSDIVVSRVNHSFFFGKMGYAVEGSLIIDTNKKGCEKYADPDFVAPELIKK